MDGFLLTWSFCSPSVETPRAWKVVPCMSVGSSMGTEYNLEFPRKPAGMLKRHITEEADARLAFYLPAPQDQDIPPGVNVPPRPQLSEGVVDTPLVRLFNFLRRCPVRAT